jgi:hypothetical protein
MKAKEQERKCPLPHTPEEDLSRSPALIDRYY